MHSVEITIDLGSSVVCSLWVFSLWFFCLFFLLCKLTGAYAQSAATCVCLFVLYTTCKLHANTIPLHHQSGWKAKGWRNALIKIWWRRWREVTDRCQGLHTHTHTIKNRKQICTTWLPHAEVISEGKISVHDGPTLKVGQLWCYFKWRW